MTEKMTLEDNISLERTKREDADSKLRYDVIIYYYHTCIMIDNYDVMRIV